MRFTRHPPDRRTLTLVVVPLVIMVVASNTAFFVWASIVDTHPLLLLALSSQNRYLALTTNNLDAWSYYLVGTARLLAPDPLFYLLGTWYGARALTWMERRAPSVGMSLRWLEKAFAKARHVVVFVAPNNPVSVLAGVSGMPVLTFLTLDIAGTIARLVLIRMLGNVFDAPISAFLGFVKDYRWYLIALSGVLTVVSVWSDSRKGGEIDALRHLEDDLVDDPGGSGAVGEPDERA